MVQMKYALLLVEDSPDDEMLSLRAINSCGIPCSVQVARHGGEAVQALLSSEIPTPDLVVLDFHLPGLDGIDILRELRKHEKTRHVPVVMLSSLASDSQVLDCSEEGANSFVEKPIEASTYVEQVALIVRYWFTVDKRPDYDPSRSLR